MSWLFCILSNLFLASLLALAAWVVQQRLARPGLARVLWLLVLIKLVTPPLVMVPVTQAPGVLACALGGCGCGRHEQLQMIVRDRLPWIFLTIWSAGALATGCVAVRRWCRFRRLLAHARPASGEWRSRANDLASALALRRRPELFAVPGRLPPLVLPGLGRARILLPADLMDRLNPSQQSALLLHELAHLKRGDHLVRLLELAVGIVYWWLPVVGAIGRRLRTCEEARCDAEVVRRLPDARRAYAQLLLDVIDFTDPAPQPPLPQVTAMSAAHNLEQRLRAILADAPHTARAWPAALMTIGIACGILPCGFQYDRPTPPAVAVFSDLGCDAAPTVTLPDGARPTVAPISAFCCPQ